MFSCPLCIVILNQCNTGSVLSISNSYSKSYLHPFQMGARLEPDFRSKVHVLKEYTRVLKIGLQHEHNRQDSH